MKIAVSFAIVVALFAAACAPASSKVTVTMNEWTMNLSQTSAQAGKVTFVLKNTGKEEHELVILKTDLAQDKLLARANDPTKVEEPGSIGEIEDVAAGTSKEATFDLTPGSYILLCNLPAHYQSGMHVAFVVK